MIDRMFLKDIYPLRTLLFLVVAAMARFEMDLILIALGCCVTEGQLEKCTVLGWSQVCTSIFIVFNIVIIVVFYCRVRKGF